MLKDRKNLLIIIFILGISYLGYDLYHQHKVITLLNSELLRQSAKKRSLILENQRLKMRLEALEENEDVAVGSGQETGILN